MPTVKLRITRWLCENLKIGPPGSSEIGVSVAEGASILEMVRRLAAGNGGFWVTMLEEIGSNVIIVLNGSLADPYDRP